MKVKYTDDTPRKIKDSLSIFFSNKKNIKVTISDVISIFFIII